MWCRQQKPDLMRCLSPPQQALRGPLPRWSGSPQCQWVGVFFPPTVTRWGTPCFRDIPKPPNEPDLQAVLWGHLSILLQSLGGRGTYSLCSSLEQEHLARTLCCAQAGASHPLPHLNVVAERAWTGPWDTATAQGHLLCQGAAPPTGSETGSLWCLCLFVWLVSSLHLLFSHRSWNTA